ncbi:MAG: TrbI/VirB10 family protein [Bradyrhizobiaceae bacterium]|nr:TrbI/VirB10 family protein [Bradyrhizobiaceae bacterium]
MRLSRRVLSALAAVGAVAVAGALIFALYRGNTRTGGGEELYNTENKTTPEGLSALPRDYSGVGGDRPAPAIARPGPPVPGDGIPSLPDGQTQAPAIVDPEQQRIVQETEAARTSRLFAATSMRERPAALPPAAAAAERAAAGQAETAPLDPGALLNMQDRKAAFLNAAVDRKTTSPDRLENPVSRYVVQAGAVIPAALVTGIRSDLPGQVTAQVTENVYDSPGGSYLLIPQGSKLVGAYDSQVSFGQNRLLLVWTRLIMPNGRSVVLERAAGADPEGFTGLEDGVDHHWGRLATTAALSTMLGIGAELGSTNNDSAIVTALRRGGTDSLNQSGQQAVQRNLNIQPTITIRPGFPVRVIVNRDLVLAPYRD